MTDRSHVGNLLYFVTRQYSYYRYFWNRYPPLLRNVGPFFSSLQGAIMLILENTMINQDTFNRAKAAQTTAKAVKPKKLIKQLNAALAEAGPQEQYDAIKGLINTPQVVALKKHWGITDYVTAHNMRWNLINAFNVESDEE